MWKKLAVTLENTKNKIGKVKITTIAGAWVFYFLLAVVPLSFLIITALNFFKVDIPLDIINYLPEEFRYPMKVIGETAKNVSKVSTVFYFITVIFSATTLITQMSKDGDFIFSEKRKFRFAFLRRLSAIALLIIIVGAFIIGGVVFSLRNQFGISLGVYNLKGHYMVVFNATVTVLLAYFILILLNRFIAPVRLKATESAIGGLVSLAISLLGTLLFVLFVKFFGKFNAFYGSLSIILVFLFWVYILMVGIISGVLVTAKLYYDRKNGTKTGA